MYRTAATSPHRRTYGPHVRRIFPPAVNTHRSARATPADRALAHLTPQVSRSAPTREVNERYRQHPATGSFAAQTEGEITQWDTFAAQGLPSRRHRGRDTGGPGAVDRGDRAHGEPL